jgi:MFS family permease
MSTAQVSPAPSGAPARPSQRPPRFSQGLSSFKHRNYRLFFSGQFISVVGSWMQTTAQAWLVTGLTTSQFKVALVVVFQFVPVLFFSLIGGMVADRVKKRNLLVFTQSLSAIAAATTAILVGTGRIELWQVYAIALFTGTVSAFDMPARQAFVVEMVGKDDLINAVALNSALFNSARVIGPAIAGVLIATVGTTICFALDSASYLAVIVCLLMMQIKPAIRAAGRGGLAEVREGIRYVRTTPALYLPMILVGFVATFGINFNVWVPLLAKHELHAGAGEFGVLTSALGIGSVIGALGLAFRSRKPQVPFMIAMAIGLGFLDLALAVIGAIPLSVGAALVVLPFIGFAMTTTMATANTIIQSESKDELRGRVMSVYMLVFGGTAPFGAILIGAIASGLGTPVSIAFGGAITMIAALAVTKRRHLAVSSRPVPVSASADD